MISKERKGSKTKYGPSGCILIVLFLILIPILAFSQESVVVNGTFLTADEARIETAGDRVEIFAEGLDKEVRPVVMIVTTRPLPSVEAYEKTATFSRPIDIGGSDGRFIIDRPGIYDVRVLYHDEDGVHKSDWLEDVVVGEIEPIPDPDEPVDPDPPSDHQGLTDLAEELCNALNDPVRTEEYANALDAVNFTGLSLAQAKTTIGDVRRGMFIGPQEKPWYKFFQPIDVALAPAQTVADYEARWKAIIKGMRQSLPAPTIDLNDGTTWTPPVGDVYVGQIHNGMILEERCDDNVCTYVWVPVK